MKKFGIFLSCCALLYISGSHLALVQGVAWGRMLVDYSKASGLADGISQTFDGDHPCSLCKEVKKAKRDQAPQQILLKLSELKASPLFFDVLARERFASHTPLYFHPGLLGAGIGPQAPPLPPPRA